MSEKWKPKEKEPTRQTELPTKAWVKGQRPLDPYAPELEDKFQREIKEFNKNNPKYRIVEKEDLNWLFDNLKIDSAKIRWNKLIKKYLEEDKE